MTIEREKFYLVSRHRGGRDTNVRYDTLPALAVGRHGDPLDTISRYTMQDMIDCFDDREEWPTAARELLEGGAEAVALIEPHRLWVDAATITPADENQAYIDAILALDDGYIYAILTEEEAHEAIRTGRTDSGYGQRMDTGAALARWLNITDGDGHALTLGEEVVQNVLDDDGEIVDERRGEIVELTIREFSFDPPVIEWKDGTRTTEDPGAFTVA